MIENKYLNLISDIQILPVNIPINGLVAFASLKYADLVLNSIAIYSKKNGTGYRITYPTKQAKNHDSNLFYPLNPILSKTIETSIILKYTQLFE